MPIIFQIFLLSYFLAFAWIVFKDIKNGIYAVIFFLPAYLMRFALFGIPTTVLEIMIYILFFLWFGKNRRQADIIGDIRRFYQNDKILAGGIILLFLGVFLSTLFSADLRASLGVLKGWFFDPFLFFIVLINETRTREQIINTLWIFILSAFTVAITSLAYAFFGHLTFDGRLAAFYESPNYLAMYLAPAFLFALYFFAKQKDCNKKIQAVILLFLAAALFLTKSYGAILGVGAALFCIVAKKYIGGDREFFSRNKKTVLVLAVVVFALLSFLSFQKYEQIVNSNERSSFHSRLMIWNSSLEMLEDSPIVGIGPGTFQKVYLDYQSRFSIPYLEWAVAEPHNTFLAFYLQSGLVGLAGFSLIFYWFYKRARTDDILFIFLVYFMVHGLVDTLYWKNDLSVIFWLIIGVSFIQKANKKSCKFSIV